jgi:hypothetical protein
MEMIMNSKCRFFAVLIFIITAVSNGCAATHPRRATNLDDMLSRPRKIALLRPEINAQVKYIGTPEFFYSASRGKNWEAMITTGVRRKLEEEGHQIYHHLEIGAMLPRGKRQAELLSKRLTRLTEPAIVSDSDYSKKTVPILVTAEGLIPKEISDEIDFIVAIKGRAKIETIKEFYARWFRNIGFNLMTFPITAASAFIPIPLPISVTISTSVFEASPEDVFVAMIIIDAKTGKIVYQNDYFCATVPGNDTDLQTLGKDLLEEFVKEPE